MRSPADFIAFGSERLSWEAADEHFVAVGATGGGKTTLLRMVMTSVLEGPAYCPPRALVYDPKKEFLPLLHGLGRGDDCKILNPLDRRCAAWDMAADFQDPVAARQLATILVPERRSGAENASFFDAAVRDVLTAVLVTLAEAASPGSWGFRDVLLAALYPPYLAAVLAHERGRGGRLLGLNARVKAVYLKGDPRTRANVLATVQARLSLYEPIAAVWAAAVASGDPNRRFSLVEWSDSQEILVLGNEESARASLDPINRAIFQRAAEVLLALPARPTTARAERTWVVFDELREAGRLDAMGSLLNKGRAAGVTVVLAFQDVEGLQDAYGSQVAHEIVGQCGNVAVLRLTSPETARWAASLFGEYLALENTPNPSYGADGRSGVSRHVGLAERKNVYSSELLYLPKTSVANGLAGYYKHSEMPPETGARREADWARDIAPHLGRSAGVDAFLPHEDTGVFHLQPWNEADWDRLGLEGDLPDYRAPSGDPGEGDGPGGGGPTSLWDV